jgi:hypothetical protein
MLGEIAWFVEMGRREVFVGIGFNDIMQKFFPIQTFTCLSFKVVSWKLKKVFQSWHPGRDVLK